MRTFENTKKIIEKRQDNLKAKFEKIEAELNELSLELDKVTLLEELEDQALRVFNDLKMSEKEINQFLNKIKDKFNKKSANNNLYG